MDLSHRAESGAAAAALGSGHSPWGRGPCGMGQLCPTDEGRRALLGEESMARSMENRSNGPTLNNRYEYWLLGALFCWC